MQLLFTLLSMGILLFFLFTLRAWLALPSSVLLALLLSPRLASPFLPGVMLSSLLALVMLARLLILSRAKHFSAEAFMLALILALLYPSLLPAFLLVTLFLLATRVREGVLMLLILLPAVTLHAFLGMLSLPRFHPPLLPLLFLASLPGVFSLASRAPVTLILTLSLLLFTPGMSVLAYALLVHESLAFLSRFLPKSILAPFTRFILYLAFLFYTAIPLLYLLA